MAAPVDVGFGLGVHDGEEEVHGKEGVGGHDGGVEEVHGKGGQGLGLTAEDPIGFDDKNGEEDEEVPVAKKARVEKVENGGEEDGEEEGYGVESVEGFAEKEGDETELDPLLGHDNGAVESPVEGEGEGEDEEDDENGGVEGGDEEDDESAEVDGVSGGGKDAPGDAGLRTLLQESDKGVTGRRRTAL
ncbi:hypothetical protein M758_8G166600 [Ceratodon purpureus]|nr:hypothetical protein M758_8G166600 [Ceratodon purpureus]